MPVIPIVEFRIMDKLFVALREIVVTELPVRGEIAFSHAMPSELGGN